MTIVIHNKHIKVTQEDIVFPNGELVSDYYLVEKRDYVAIVPIIDDLKKNSNVILVEQYRPALAQSIWNIPMGFIDSSETPEEAAKRELAEETGYEGKLELLGVLAPAPGFYKSVCHMYTAHHCQQVDDIKSIDKEIQNIELLEWSNAFSHIQSSKATDMTSAIGLLLAKEKHAL